MSLIKKIKNYYQNTKSLLFTTPSHSQGAFIPPVSEQILGNNFFKADFSEIEGFDNLRKPTGIIKDLQTQISNIYESKASFMLTNGSTSGIIAAMLSVLRPSDRVLIARNCHISIYNALVLTGAYPVWIIPDIDDEWGIFKGIEPQCIDKILDQNKDIKAVVLTSPTYEGIFSDINTISKICKKHNAILIVDEAHGALLNFGKFKAKPAVLSGADISIQSLHKTAGAPNPCALLHVSESSPVNPSSIQESLNIINTTSPSYPLMCAIESCLNFLASDEGHQMVNGLLTNIARFKTSLNPEIRIYEGYNDQTKLLIKINGADSLMMSDILNKKYNIEEEYSTEKSMLFITGIGTLDSKIKQLAIALNELQKKYSCCDVPPNYSHQKYLLPPMCLTPREAFFRKAKSVLKEQAKGCIAGECIMEYPPGIPIVVAGEVIDEPAIQLCSQKEILICEN